MSVAIGRSVKKRMNFIRFFHPSSLLEHKNDSLWFVYHDLKSWVVGDLVNEPSKVVPSGIPKTGMKNGANGRVWIRRLAEGDFSIEPVKVLVPRVHEGRIQGHKIVVLGVNADNDYFVTLDPTF